MEVGGSGGDIGEMVEIREFVDAAGAEVSHEVVRLSEEAGRVATDHAKSSQSSAIDEALEKLHSALNISESAPELDVSYHSKVCCLA